MVYIVWFVQIIESDLHTLSLNLILLVRGNGFPAAIIKMHQTSRG